MRSTSGLVRSRLVASVGAAAVVGSMLVGADVASAPAALAAPNVQHGTVSARPSDQTVSFVDGVVYGVEQVGGKVFVGGSFTKVGPGVRGAAGVVDVASSTFGTSFPDVDGAVYAAVPDGSGGYYLAGDFATVGGQARADLAQVD